MELMRESWTDERLDSLNGKVDAGFKQVDERFDGVDKRLDELEQRFDSLQLTLLAVGGGLMGTVIASCAAVVATQI
jgi:tetrahydromethanopterin S-methyltransferase subunit G